MVAMYARLREWGTKERGEGVRGEGREGKGRGGSERFRMNAWRATVASLTF